MSDGSASPEVSDALRQLDVFLFPKLSVAFTAVYIAAHVLYLGAASMALWRIGRHIKLWKRISSSNGSVLVPSASHGVLLLTTVYSAVDLVFCSMTLIWHRDSPSSRHWQLFFGTRYLLVILLLWVLLSSTMSIWPFKASKVSYPHLWNASLIAVPAGICAIFMIAITRADARYTTAWDLHERIRISILANPSSSLTDVQRSQMLDLSGLYHQAAVTSLIWVWIGFGWASLFTLSILIVGVPTVHSLFKDYHKTSKAIRRTRPFATSANAPYAMAQGHDDEGQLRCCAHANCFACHWSGQGHPDVDHNARFDEDGQAIEDDPQAMDNDSEPKMNTVSGSSPLATSVSIPLSSSATPELATELKHRHRIRAIHAQLKSRLTHTALQLACIWGMTFGTATMLINVALRLIRVGASALSSITQQQDLSDRSILEAVARPQVIEQVGCVVLGSVYLISVLARLRQARRGQKYGYGIGSEDASAQPSDHGMPHDSPSLDGSDAPEPGQEHASGRDGLNTAPVYCFTPRFITVDEVKSGPCLAGGLDNGMVVSPTTTTSTTTGARLTLPPDTYRSTHTRVPSGHHTNERRPPPPPSRSNSQARSRSSRHGRTSRSSEALGMIRRMGSFSRRSASSGGGAGADAGDRDAKGDRSGGGGGGGAQECPTCRDASLSPRHHHERTPTDSQLYPYPASPHGCCTRKGCRSGGDEHDGNYLADLHPVLRVPSRHSFDPHLPHAGAHPHLHPQSRPHAHLHAHAHAHSHSNLYRQQRGKGAAHPPRRARTVSERSPGAGAGAGAHAGTGPESESEPASPHPAPTSPASASSSIPAPPRSLTTGLTTITTTTNNERTTTKNTGRGKTASPGTSMPAFVRRPSAPELTTLQSQSYQE